MPKKVCSFCGRSENEVRLLITGINGFICEDCAKQAYEIIQSTGVLAPKAGEGKFVLKEVPKPVEIKKYLDEYIIGQDQAKRNLAVAVYNHYKRLQQPKDEDGVEIEKSNIIMVGSTGTGTCTRTTYHDDITLFDFYTIFILRLLQALIVVIHSDSQIALSLILTDDIFIQVFFDFYRLWHLFENKLTLSSLRSQDSCRLYDFISLLSAIFANEAIDTRNEQSDLVF